LERRKGERLRRRVTCEIESAGSRHRGIVLDVSPRGLFVQTDATPPLDGTVRLRLRVDGEVLDLEARVARKRVVPRQLASVTAGGLGFRIDSAPEQYFRLFGNQLRPTVAAEPAVEPPPADDDCVFRVRVKQVRGPRSRSLLVAAPTEAEARGRATADLGEGWSVLEVAPA
jgi:hypothetical protein